MKRYRCSICGQEKRRAESMTRIWDAHGNAVLVCGFFCETKRRKQLRGEANGR